MSLPTTGLDRDELLTRLDDYRRNDVAAEGGRTFAYVYDGGRRDVEAVAHEAYLRFIHVNGLDPTAFPSLLRMENDVVAATAALLGGDASTVGTFTSGGTESIMIAVKASRDRWRADGGEGAPEVVLPTTAHAAFHKGCHYLDMRAVPVDVDPLTFRADPDAMRAAVTPRTALLVASAPSYAQGVVDPVPAIAAIGAEHGIPVHVDACIGGWLLAYARRLGRNVPDFDLSVPGVTSLSVDLHKYGYAPKGASVVLYRDADLRAHQYFACAGWAGYSMVNTTMQSTKSGGPLAGAWTTLHGIGDDGYVELARQVFAATDVLVDGIRSIPELRLLAAPDMTLVAITAADDADPLDVFALGDALNARGWYVQPQFSFGQTPRSLHLTVTAATNAVVGDLVSDLRDAVRAIRDNPPDPVDADLLAAVRALDPATLTRQDVEQLAAGAGLDGSGGGSGTATVNALLEAMPPRLRERILVDVIGMLYTATPAPAGSAR